MTGRRDAGLTDAEQRVMALTAEIMGLLSQEVVGRGSTRDQDLNELAVHVHALQHVVMAQAAGRAHPDLYRLLGESLSEATP